MKVILTADVKSLGKKGEIVDVSDGYARNMLLPKKFGVEANSKNINDLKLQKANEDKVAKEILEQARALAADIAEKSITVSIKVGEGGKTFGSVSSKEIAEHKPIEAAVLMIPRTIADIIAVVLAIYMAADFAVSINEAMDLKATLEKFTKENRSEEHTSELQSLV